MFYCEPCRKDRDWPKSLAMSVGPCEICKKDAECYDRKASTLPLPKLDDESDPHQEALKRIRDHFGETKEEGETCEHCGN